MKAFTALLALSAALSALAAPAFELESRANGNLQTSLCLDKSQVQTGFEKDGQEVPTAGQVASLTSKNNFINFCATVNKPLTNGQQVKGGSCNAAPMGVIASVNNMPSCKFQSPANLDTIKANTAFTVKMAIKHLTAGNFVNADSNYFSAPQQVDGSGNVKGHSHIVIEKINGLKDTQPLDPTKFTFFKGVNTAAQNGVLSVAVADGLPAGTYRMASINTAANHQPVLVAVAQHGSVDDMIYFTVSNNGKAANNNNDDGDDDTTTTTKKGSSTATSSSAKETSTKATSTKSSSSANATSTSKGQDNNNNDNGDDNNDDQDSSSATATTSSKGSKTTSSSAASSSSTSSKNGQDNNNSKDNDDNDSDCS